MNFGRKKRLTDYAGTDMWPAWSPDGQRIAFFSDRDGDAHIWLVAATGGAPERLTEQEGNLPRWAPDGETVYFVRGRDEYWAITLAARTERLVADLSGKPGKRGQYATDGEYLYFTWEERLGDIWVMDVVWDE